VKFYLQIRANRPGFAPLGRPDERIKDFAGVLAGHEPGALESDLSEPPVALESVNGSLRHPELFCRLRHGDRGLGGHEMR